MISSIPEKIRQDISDALDLRIESFHFSSGGCINNGGELVTSSDKFFLKWNDRKRFPGMFDAEAKGLQLLRSANVISVPRVVLTKELSDYQYLILEFIESAGKTPNYWQTLGEQLAALHEVSLLTFGLDHKNYIGLLPQDNTPAENWIEFFITRRLTPQVNLALQQARMDSGIANQFDHLYRKLPEFLPLEKPSLLHGDLWSGNLITDGTGNPCLIDPAVYYGHREMEIAFTRLFGGFSKSFYDSYNHNFPLLPGFRERSDVYNLYPLMVHVNLFGGGYLSQVVSILRHFV